MSADYAPIKRAIASSVRETVHLTHGDKSEKLRALAVEYAEQLILPHILPLIEQALEDGFTQGRAAAPAEAL